MRIPVSRSGLSGGPTTLGNRYKFDVPARVLVRVRAVFRRPPLLGGDNRLVLAKGTIVTGSLSVATMPDRRPILFGSASGSTGETQIFVSAARCSAS